MGSVGANAKHSTGISTIRLADSLTSKGIKATNFSNLTSKGIKAASNDTIQVSSKSDLPKDIIFNFSLSNDGKYLIVNAYNPNNPESKAKIKTDANNPTLANSVSSNLAKSKMTDMLAKTKSGVTQATFKQASQILQQNENKKEK